MFGYVRPCHPELKCWESDLYKATYCGLCATLRQRYGMLAPMFLSYDMTFLALLLEQPETSISFTKKSCHANLLLKKTTVHSSEALHLSADYTVLLAWFQLQDRIVDESYFKKWGGQLLCFFLKPSYRKAAKLHPTLDQALERHLNDLHKLEENQCDSMDQVADCFAMILKHTVPLALEAKNQTEYRSLQQLLYHVGRWIYLVDARDDYAEDVKSGSYNPLLYRYGETLDDNALATTLGHSLYLAHSSLAFLDLGAREGTIENIITQGLPTIQQSVLEDQWKNVKKQKLWRKRR